MKKISINKDDCSFNNKYKFNDLVDKMKALGFSIKKNGKKTCVLGVMIGSMVLSGYTLGKSCKSVVDTIKYLSSNSLSDEELTKNNDEVIMDMLEDTIMVANVESTVLQNYYFEDGYLYDKNGNMVSLEGEEKRISFVKCNLDSTILNNINLLSSTTKILDLTYSSIDNDCVNYFPSTLEVLLLDYCSYITNLNGLAEKCPNIRCISINNAASLNDLSFIYELPNLEEVYIRDCAYVTEDILTYLKENNIVTNLTDKDVINSKAIDGIVEDIILPSMNDKEKIQAICLYVLDSIEYDITRIVESNKFPLTCVLNDGKGVCASYAYMTNVLLNKAGIRTFKVTNDTHGWNVIELDGEYYYIDTTNMDGSFINKMLLELFNIAENYMIDPEYTMLSAMSDASSEETIIIANLVDDIIKGSSNKDIIEKYGGMVLSGSLDFGSLLMGFFTGFNMFLLMSGVYVEMGKSICSSIKDDYLDKLYFEKISGNDTDREKSMMMVRNMDKYRDYYLIEDAFSNSYSVGKRKCEGYKRKRI